jgi:hypothetical protein
MYVGEGTLLSLLERTETHMKIISNTTGDRVVELEGNEPRIQRHFDELLDQGWDIPTAFRYAQRRFGVASALFYRWVFNLGEFAPGAES